MSDDRIQAARRLILELAATDTSAAGHARVEATLAGLDAVEQEAVAQKTGELGLQEVADSLFAMASLDFTRRCAVRDDGSVLDAVVGCINMLAEELAAVFEERALVEQRLERRVEERTAEVRAANTELTHAADFLKEIYRAMPGGLLVIDRFGAIEAANASAASLLEYTEAELLGRPAADIFAHDLAPSVRDIETAAGPDGVLRAEKLLRSRSGVAIPVLFSATLLRTVASSPGEHRGFVCMAIDIRVRKRLEVELRQAQKLESVGRLASGVAHEINTPIQFVSDSVQFIGNAMNDLMALLLEYEAMHRAIAFGTLPAGVEADLVRARADADLPYLVEHVPQAIERSLDGLSRVRTIVRSMKEFAHPDQSEMRAVDLNHAIASTLIIANSECRHVADVQTDLGELPLVTCYIGDINQVVLNIVVNAAHAIEEAVTGSGRRGQITVRTRHESELVVIAISDTGSGIPEQVRERLFDPFFTTKEVGKGTGQGLSLARSIIVGKHKGSLTFETEIGRGTTFFIKLPIAEAQQLRAV
jgi:PAS domain S-box-containing protein